MDFSKHVTKQNLLIAITIGIVSTIALWLRLIPMFTMGNTDILAMVGSDDPLYNLRQVEVIISNYPNYAWFDPLVYYPNGAHMYWGDLFPTIIATCCLLFGATTRPEIISVGLLVPPIMATLMVPLMYYVGKTCGDWKTGLASAVFAAFVTGQYFHRALYGYMDHHIAEVLFSTIFCMLYMYALKSGKDTKIDLKDINSYKQLILLSALAGVAYLLGLFTMPTMILFAMIVALFTGLMFIVDFANNKNSEYLLVINTIIFAVVSVGTWIHGVSFTYLDLSIYSVWHIVSYACVIFLTVALYGLRKVVERKGGNWVTYFGVLVATGIAAIIGLYIFSPQLYTLFVTSFFAFFGQQAITATVQEARAWTNADAWNTFGWGLLLVLGGVLIATYKSFKEHNPQMIFALLWSVIVLYSTFQHVRYEYYLAINVVLMCAIFVSFVFNNYYKDIRKLIDKTISDVEEPKPTEPEVKVKPSKKDRRASVTQKHKTSKAYNMANLGVVIIVLTVIVSGVFISTSAYISYATAASGSLQMNGDWKESLDWMKTGTPQEQGINYTQIYDPNTYKAPEGTYGVMSWWDYGHMILVVANRLPNANPFQQGINGEAGSADYFISVDETEANKRLDAGRTRYVITDTEMALGKFWAMSTWYNSTESIEPYQYYMFAPLENQRGAYQSVLINKPKYYLTMISRLHNSDGNMFVPDEVYYIEYVDADIANEALPVMTNAMPLTYENATKAVDAYNQRAQKGYHAAIVNPDPASPTTAVPALKHYRLVHESPTTTINSPVNQIKYVKVFEYVEGYHIKGEGIIEVPITTNTGRTFIYRQVSENGEFIVPYSTVDNPYEVKTNGSYKIIGSTTTYDVTEKQIMG